MNGAKIKAIKLIKHLRFLKSPALVKRILTGYFNSLVLKRDTLRSIELAIDYRCQASCHKCYSANLGTHFPNPNYVGKELITPIQISQIINAGMKLGLIHVNITGGEPTIRNDLMEIVEACRPREIMVSIVTNALSMTKPMVQKLADAGVCLIQISFDSADPATHDKLRGVPGCYDKAMQVAQWAKESGINLCFTTVLSTEESSNKNETRKLLKIAEREDAFLLVCDSASVGGWEGQNEKALSREQRDQALKELMKHPLTRHHNMYNFRGEIGCPAAHEKIYITAFGDVTPCDLVHDKFGNVLEEDLAPILERMRKDKLWGQTRETCPRYLEEFETRGGIPI